MRVAIGEKGISPPLADQRAAGDVRQRLLASHEPRLHGHVATRPQEALIAGALQADELIGHDDDSLLTRLASDAMPAATRRLARALRDRHIHKRAVEIGSRAFELYARLGNLFFDPLARRAVETRLSEALAEEIGEPVPAEAVLIDIPKPERWRSDVWVTFERPPVGFEPLMPWRDVVGLTDDDFKRYEEHRRLIRIVTAEPYRDALSDSWEKLLMPLWEQRFKRPAPGK